MVILPLACPRCGWRLDLRSDQPLQSCEVCGGKLGACGPVQEEQDRQLAGEMEATVIEPHLARTKEENLAIAGKTMADWHLSRGRRGDAELVERDLLAALSEGISGWEIDL